MKSFLIFLQKHISYLLSLSKMFILLSAFLLHVLILFILPLIVSGIFCLQTNYFSGQTLQKNFKKVENLKNTTLVNIATINFPQKILWKMSKGHSNPVKWKQTCNFAWPAAALPRKCSKNINLFFSG